MVSPIHVRLFAVEDALTFTALGQAFEVVGLSDPAPSIYRAEPDGVFAIRRMQATDSGDGTWRVKFRGSVEEATYFVATDDAVTVPALSSIEPYSDITNGSADYPMVSHGSFVDSLAPLVQFHQNNGSVKVVDTADIYAQFGYGRFRTAGDPGLHRPRCHPYGRAVRPARRRRHLRLLRQPRSGQHQLRAVTVRADRAVCDVCAARSAVCRCRWGRVPDAPIGRFPVRTSAELDNVIAKTLAYAGQSDQSILLAADDGFSAASASFEALVPSGWDVTTAAYLDDGDVAAARQTVLDTLNGTVRLTSSSGTAGRRRGRLTACSARPMRPI